VPTGIHRPTSRISYVWVFAGVIALLMIVVTGYAFLRGGPGDRVPVFAEGTPPVVYVSSTPSPAPSAPPALAQSPSQSPSPSPSVSLPPGPPAKAGDFWGSTTGIPAAKNVLTVKVLNRTNGAYPDAKV
jgi:hypothetical protein